MNLDTEEKYTLTCILNEKIATGTFQSNASMTRLDVQGCDTVEENLRIIESMANKLGLNIDFDMIKRARGVIQSRRDWIAAR